MLTKVFIEMINAGMYNLFEAKGQMATTRSPQGRERAWGFGRGQWAPYPPAARESGVVL